ncbi:MAG: DUF1738 domain-containing protein [Clostridia bacterium]|nr:DUF1738 domain-containing protein [Clostridia bacterium]
MDIYAEITNRIIAELEKGIIPWEKPWTGVNTGAISHSTGRPYSLINQLMLGEPGEYITFNQCKQEGGKVKKGSKAKIVVFWKPIPHEKKDANGKPVLDEDGKPVTSIVPYLKYFQVFHINDCEGINPRYADGNPHNNIEPDDAAELAIEEYLQRSGVTLKHEEGDRAYYRPSADLVVLPLREQFTSTAEYYGTAFHELTHSTGHPKRLARITGTAAFGSESYSKEELVAEIGAATLLHEMGLETSGSFRNNAAYIQSWLKALKDDKHLIVSAAGRAEKAVKMILGTA